MAEPTLSNWSVDPAEAEAALSQLRGATRVLLPTHQNVDPDGLASPMAMMHGLAQFGIEAIPVVSDRDFPASLGFLPGMDRVLRYGVDALPEYDVVCMVDCADRRRLGKFSEEELPKIEGKMPLVNIDHHVTNDRFGTVNVVVPESASAAEIVADLLRMWGCELTRELAVCLLTGIYGDTLGLRTDATTAKTMRIAADLVDAGANPADITDHLFRFKPASTVCLWEHALGAVAWSGSLIWTQVNNPILERCHAKPSEAEGIVNFLSGTMGSRAAAMLYETDDGWRVSMRSLRDDVDVSQIAAAFGGGGHPRAAGCQLPAGEAARDAFLESVAAMIAVG